jgi:hypothetical protein
MSERADRNPKSIKIPGPDHPITIERNAHRIVIAVANRRVPRSKRRTVPKPPMRVTSGSVSTGNI